MCRSGDLARELGGHGAAPVVVAPAKLVGRALEGPGAQPVEGALGVGLEVGDHVVGRVQRVAALLGEAGVVAPGQSRHAPDQHLPPPPVPTAHIIGCREVPPPDRPAGRGADVEVVDLNLAGDDLAGRPPLSGPAIAPRMRLRR